eukprot:1155489-Pelagomonas_calceolata.AAC.1
MHISQEALPGVADFGYVDWKPNRARVPQCLFRHDESLAMGCEDTVLAASLCQPDSLLKGCPHVVVYARTRMQCPGVVYDMHLVQCPSVVYDMHMQCPSVVHTRVRVRELRWGHTYT